MDKLLTYNYIYKNKGFPYFDSISNKILKLVNKHSHITFSSYYGSGDRRLISYINYLVSRQDSHIIFYEENNDYSIGELERMRKLANKNRVLYITPFYEYKEKVFIDKFVEIFSSNNNKLQTILWLSSSFLETPNIYFNGKTQFYENIISIKPFNYKDSVSILKMRMQMEEYSLSERDQKRVIHLSGGNPKLIKFLGRLRNQGWQLSYNNIISEPVIRSTLVNLKHEIETLSPEILERVGLISSKGLITIPILKDFIYSKNENFKELLSPDQKELFKLFLKNTNIPLTPLQIHNILRKGKEFSNWAIYKNLSRFGKIVESKYRLRNIKGKGYILIPKNK